MKNTILLVTPNLSNDLALLPMAMLNRKHFERLSTIHG